MNRRMVIYISGILLLVEAGLMVLPAAVAVFNAEWLPLRAFLLSACVLALVGFLLTRIKMDTKTIHSKEGLVAVAMGWIVLSLGGALPFVISGEIPSFLNAFFETVSGFTTTGASILSDVEVLSKSILFWRSFTHWVGGMGVLVFVMAVIPLASGGGNIHLMRAESPGPEVSKLVPSSRGTAVWLYTAYLVMTVAEVIALLISGNPLFDALTIAFGTAGTGGFAIKNASLGGYNLATQIIVTVFMVAFGVNFNCYYLLFTKKIKDFFKNEELRVYFAILVIVTAIVTINIMDLYNGFWETLHTAAFQVSSVMTTTGYVTADFNTWPELSRALMLVVMCIGTCMSSTGGGIKVSRVVILIKDAFRQVRRSMSPNRVNTLRFNSKTVSDTTVDGVVSFFILYVVIFVASVLLLCLDSKDFVSNVSGVIATLNNIGPGLGAVGATGNYGDYSVLSKCVFIADMLFGRLEIIPILVLFSPRTWRSAARPRGVGTGTGLSEN